MSRPEEKKTKVGVSPSKGTHPPLMGPSPFPGDHLQALVEVPAGAPGGPLEKAGLLVLVNRDSQGLRADS